MIKKVLCLIILLATTIPFYRNHLYFLNFVDEDDNLVIGSFVAQGHKLYSDVFTQHPPLPFILSGSIQQVAHPESIRDVVKISRGFMIFWSAIWICLLLASFGWKGLLVAAFFELNKISLLGNLYLAESLVSYPAMYLTSYLLSHDQYQLDLQFWFAAILVIFITLSLAPLWPLMLFIVAWIVLHATQPKKALAIFSFLSAIAGIVCWPFLNFSSFWTDVIVINSQYYIPLTTGISAFTSVFKAFFAPVYALLSSPSSQLLLVIQAASLALIFIVLTSLARKKYLSAALAVLILGLSSLRYINPGNTLYGAFHMQPWFGILLVVVIYKLGDLYQCSKFFKSVAVIFILSIFVFSLSNAKANLWDHRNSEADYVTHYTKSEQVRQAVSILSRGSTQTVWVEPVMYWPYWHTGAEPYSFMINYYAWMDRTPPLRERLTVSLDRELPTLVYLDSLPSLSLGAYLDQYVPILHDNHNFGLYLRADQVAKISDPQSKDLQASRFSIP